MNSEVNTAQAAEPICRVRRVGTRTMGACLIVAGAALCWALLAPGADLTLLAKLAPLALVALGVEVLVAASRAHGEKLRYDFLSMFLCFILICGALAAACIAPFVEYYGPQRSRTQTALSAQWYDDLYQTLKDNADVNDVNVHVYLDEWRKAGDEVTLAQLGAGDYAGADVELKGPYANRELFLAACAPVLEAVKSTDVAAPHISVYTRENGADPAYSLEVSGSYLLNRPAGGLLEEVEMRTFVPAAGCYMDEEELAQWNADRALDAEGTVLYGEEETQAGPSTA